MIHTGRKVAWGFLAVLAVAGAGCESDDADRLARIGRKVADKLQSPPPLSENTTPSPLQSIHGSWNELALEGRVSARLRWDKDLAGAKIEVHPTAKGEVRLRGTVASMDARQKAVSVARSTVGVANVIDEMTVDK